MKTILVADDEEFMVTDLIAALKQQYTVEYVTDGRQALQRIVQGGLDGVVLDNRMKPRIGESPEIGWKYGVGALYRGKDVARAARTLFPSLVIMLRSSEVDALFRSEFEPLDIYCQLKEIKDAQDVVRYFAGKFKES